MLLAARSAFMAQKKKLPFDSAVEYLESTGTQWIDTGLNYFADFEFDMKAAVDQTNVSLACGLENRLERKNASEPVIRFKYNNNFILSTVSIYERHISSLRNGVCKVDGISFGSFQNRVFTQNKPMVVSAGQNTSSVLTCFSITMYSLRLWDSTNTLVRDFIPCRIGTIGYIYDKVSKQLFGNKGTGNFLYGKDIKVKL